MNRYDKNIYQLLTFVIMTASIVLYVYPHATKKKGRKPYKIGLLSQSVQPTHDNESQNVASFFDNHTATHMDVVQTPVGESTGLTAPTPAQPSAPARPTQPIAEQATPAPAPATIQPPLDLNTAEKASTPAPVQTPQPAVAPTLGTSPVPVPAPQPAPVPVPAAQAPSVPVPASAQLPPTQSPAPAPTTVIVAPSLQPPIVVQPASAPVTVIKKTTTKKQIRKEQEKKAEQIKKLAESPAPKKVKTELEKNAETAAKKEAANRPMPAFTEDETPAIEFHFENTDLQNLVNQVSEIYNITFIPDDIINPLPTTPQGMVAKSLKGNKISFKTQRPLTKKEAWNLFLTFLDLSGFSLVPQADPTMYKITMIEAAKRSAIRSFIGVDPQTLPDNDEMIRYVYFIENSSLDTIRSLVDSLRSQDAIAIYLQESKAFILVDKSYNIKMLMAIVKELDKVTMPQALSVLKLRRTDAVEVKKLYDLIRGGQDDIAARFFPARKQPTSLYFPENTRMFAEPRTNTLILLGPKDSIAKIEDFITKHVDVELDKPFSPLHVYQLRYADAQTVADIMNNVTKFGASTEAGKVGGVRGEDKYLKPISFTPEKETNRLVIRAEYDDYLRALEVIRKLDEPQPQVAMEVLILRVSLNENRQLGAQLRSMSPGRCPAIPGTNVEWQTSGLFGTAGIVENQNGTGATRLLGDLVNLVTGATTPGNTIISLGTDNFGVWGIFQALQTISNAQIISNPYITALNKTKATVSLGTTRRVVTANVVPGNGATAVQSFGDDSATLTVNITPQINSDGMIILEITVNITEFTDNNPTSGNKNTRQIITKTVVADKEVLALGGLMQNFLTDNTTQTPILGSIPIIGWFFKNKQKQKTNDNLLILISSRVVAPENEKFINSYTNQYKREYQKTISEMHPMTEIRDPINRWFFMPPENSTEKVLDTFLFNSNKEGYIDGTAYESKNLKRDTRRRLTRRERRLKREHDLALAHHHINKEVVA